MNFRTRVKRRMRYFQRLRQAHYPPFIFGFTPSAGEIPVFCYHDVTQERFFSDLSFLRDNGYRTLSTAEFVNRCGEPAAGRDRCVLLTFDDARSNFWDIAFPLLREFQARATLFAPTYWIRGAQHAPAGDSAPEYSDTTFMSWEQLRICFQSGLVDVQSHAHRHALIAVSDELVDFSSPRGLARFDVYDWPMRREGDKDVSGRPLLGTPIYEASPLLSARTRFLEDASVTRACQEFVAANGGSEFFQRRHWRDQLLKVHRSVSGAQTRPKILDEQALESLARHEFVRSRELFLAELGIAPRYLAFPWWLGSEAAIAAASECGIEAVFGVYIDFKRARRVAGPMRAFGRVNSDWLRFLPGTGRLQLYQPRVISKKITDFLYSGYLAH